MTPTPDLHAAAAALGSQGGKSTSEAKQRASRANGKRGGRPRKDAEKMDAKHGYRYEVDGEKPSAQDSVVWMTAKEAARKNKELSKLPDAIAVTRKWVMEIPAKK